MVSTSKEPDDSQPIHTDRCPVCGYPTAGLIQARCPECGADLSDDAMVSHHIADGLRIIGPWVAMGGGFAILRLLKEQIFDWFFVVLIPIGIGMWAVGRFGFKRRG